MSTRYRRYPKLLTSMKSVSLLQRIVTETKIPREYVTLMDGSQNYRFRFICVI